jgi:hypothetical protein
VVTVERRLKSGRFLRWREESNRRRGRCAPPNRITPASPSAEESTAARSDRGRAPRGVGRCALVGSRKASRCRRGFSVARGHGAGGAKRAARVHPVVDEGESSPDQDSRSPAHLRYAPVVGRRADHVRESAAGAWRRLDNVVRLHALAAGHLTPRSGSAGHAASIRILRAKTTISQLRLSCLF